MGQGGDEGRTNINAGQKPQQDRPANFGQRQQSTEFSVDPSQGEKDQQDSHPEVAQRCHGMDEGTLDCLSQPAKEQTKDQVSQKSASGKFQDDAEAFFESSLLSQ